MIVSNILKSTIKFTTNNLPKYSYGRFILENPRREKKDRLRALQEFFDKTR